MDYLPRLVDSRLQHLLSGLPAIAVEGAKGVGKTSTASRLAGDVLALDDPRVAALVAADPRAALSTAQGQGPLLVDEWQLVPAVWDAVRREVDRDPTHGRFLLTGSAGQATSGTRVHSGAGRVVRLLMRPMAWCERGVSTPTVSMSELLSGRRPALGGRSRTGLTEYVGELVTSGFPGIRRLDPAFRADQLDGYLARIVDRDLVEAGAVVRRPRALRAWLTAYAAATATTAAYTVILDAATAGESDKPAKQTVTGYREALERIWVLDPLPAWAPSLSPLTRLAQAPKHHLCDPALAALLLGATTARLLRGQGRSLAVDDRPLVGQLFESLVCLSVRSIAELAGCRVSHFRNRNGDREVDLIVERDDGAVTAMEVKLAGDVGDDDVRHLRWLSKTLGDRLLDAVVITTGPGAYRRSDGIGVVPLALLGP